LWPRLGTGLAALFAFALLAACDSGAPKFRNIDITGAQYAKDFSLTDHTGKPRTMADFRGKAVVVFFGFTRCPDVCPTTMVELKNLVASLGKDAERVQVLFITVDPERDTQAVLAQYVPAFDPRFLGLYTDPASTLKMAKDFKIYFEKRPSKGAPAGSPDYTVDHTAASFVYDPTGRLRLYVKHDQLATLKEDLRILLAGK